MLRNLGLKKLRGSILMKNKIIENIHNYMSENDILRDYETYEQMSVIDRYVELKCLEDTIKKEYYTSFLASIAILYINYGLLYAKSQLSNEVFNNFAIFWGLEYSQEVIDDIGFIVPQIYYTKKAKVLLEYTNNPIDIKKTKVYKYVENLIDLNEFSCYIGESEEGEYTQYFFIPKILEQHIFNHQ